MTTAFAPRPWSALSTKASLVGGDIFAILDSAAANTNKIITFANVVASLGIGVGSPLTTKGDIYGFSTVNTRIPIGTNGQVLTADSAQSLGLKWATPAPDTWTAVSNLLRPTTTGTINGIQLIALTTNTGSLKFIAASNAGNTDTIITNASYGQASTLTIPDLGASSGKFILSNSILSQTIASAQSISLTSGISTSITSTVGSIVFTSAGQIVSNAASIILNGTTTAFGEVVLDDVPLFITSSGNPLFRLQWDDTNSGMVADSMNGIGGSAPWWINPTGGFASFGLPPSSPISAQLQVASDQDPQFAISGQSTPTQLAFFGYNITDDVWYIQGLNPSTTVSEGKLNPAGGYISIGLADGAIAQSLLHVEGDVFLHETTTPSTPTRGNKLYAKSDNNVYSLDRNGLEINITGGDINSGGWFKFSPSVGLNSLRATEWNDVNQVSGIRIDNNTSSLYFDLQLHAASGQLRATSTAGIVRNLTGTTTATTANTNYSNSGSEDLIICNNFVSPITITIDATKLVKPVVIKTAQGANKLVTIQTAGGQTIDGSAGTIVFATGGNSYGNVTLIAQQGGTDLKIASGCTGTTGANNYNVDFAKNFEAEVWGNLTLNTTLNALASVQMTINLSYTFSSVTFQAIPSIVQNSPNAPATIKVISAGTNSVIVEVYNPGALAITSNTLTAQVRCIGQ